MAISDLQITIRYPLWWRVALWAAAACARLNVPLDYERVGVWLLNSVKIEC